MSETPKSIKTFSPTPPTKRSGRSPITRIPSATAVVLPDWWLVHDEEKGLAVAGRAYKMNGPRLFCSSTIVKRHDATTLETVDGTVIAIIGPINKSWCLQNGIPLDICNRFLLGFPYFWEEYAATLSSRQSTERDGSIKDSSTSGNTAKHTFSDDLDNLSAVEISDFLMSPLRDSTGFSLDDILGEKCSNDQRHTPRSKSSRREDQISVTTTKHSQYETPRDRKKDMTDQNNRDVEGNSESIPPITSNMTDQKRQDVEGKFNADEESTPSRIGVVTRSMSRLRNFNTTTNCDSRNDTSNKMRKVHSVKNSRDKLLKNHS